MSKVTVYSKPNCMQCEFTKRWLIDNGVPCTAIDVTKDERSYNRIIGLGYNSLPVVIIEGGRHWSGFRPDLLEGLKGE